MVLFKNTVQVVGSGTKNKVVPVCPERIRSLTDTVMTGAMDSPSSTELDYDGDKGAFATAFDLFEDNSNSTGT